MSINDKNDHVNITETDNNNVKGDKPRSENVMTKEMDVTRENVPLTEPRRSTRIVKPRKILDL